MQTSVHILDDGGQINYTMQESIKSVPDLLAFVHVKLPCYKLQQPSVYLNLVGNY